MTSSCSAPTTPEPDLPSTWWGRVRSPVLAAGAVALACAAVAIRNPNHPGSWLVCPFLATSGFYCPGCGTLRATYALLHGDLSLALAQNPLFVCFVPVLIIWWALSLRRAWLNIPKRWLISPKVLAMLPVIFTVYWIVRNIPGVTFLGPLPVTP